MGLFDWVKGVTFIEVIEWTDSGHSTLVYRFPTYDKAIKWGAQMTVREGQQAIFANEGKIADTFGPGRYTLETKNLPILQGLIGLPFGAQTPFKAEVYFVSMTEFTDLKWGTPNPVILSSADFGPVRVRGFGTYTFRVKNPVQLIRKLVGTDGRFTTKEIMGQLRSLVVSQVADTLGEAKLPVMQMAANYNEIAARISGHVREAFDDYGLDIEKFTVENITLPEEVEKALDTRSKMNVLGNLDDYTKLKTADAIEDAANNPGGTSGDAMGLGAGFVMAQHMAKSMTPSSETPSKPKAFCPSCGHGVSGGKFCSNCGKPLQAEGSCKACQKEVPPASKFCPHCGAKVI